MKIHHVAIIVSDLERSLKFYQDLLGFRVIHRVFRQERSSWKVDLKNGDVQLEVFTFPGAPARPSRPEAQGLRHLALVVDDLEGLHQHLSKHIEVEEIRLDQYTGKKFFFFPDPDDQPIEIYEK